MGSTIAILKKNPDVHAVHFLSENVIELLVLERPADIFVGDGRQKKEKREAPGELVPAFVGVMKGLLEDVLEEVFLQPQTRDQEDAEQRVEDRHLDLHPHRIIGDQRQGAKNDSDRRSDQRKYRRPVKHVEHHGDRDDRGDDQRPRPIIDAPKSIDDEHRDERAEFAENVDRLLGIERIKSSFVRTSAVHS